MATVGPARLSWVTPVRGPGTPLAGSFTEFDGLADDFDSRSLKSTWPARYDALVDATFGARLDLLRTGGHEVGVWLEVTDGWLTAAGVDYNANNVLSTTPYHHLIRYGPTERVRLLDALMAAYHARYTAYPKTACFWLIDSFSALYLRDTYGVNCLIFCRDQWATDREDINLAWRNMAHEGSADWPGAPVAPSAPRSSLCVFRNISIDLIANFGVTLSQETPTHEPSALVRAGKTVAGVWTPNIQDVADRPHAPPVILTPFMETGWEPSWNNGYRDVARQCLDSTVTLAGAGTVSLALCSAVATEFLSQNTTDRDRPGYLYQTSDVWFGTSARVLWYQGVKYEARVRWTSHGSSGYLYVSEIRLGDGVDPYTAAVAGSGRAQWVAPWVVDGARFTPDNNGFQRDTPTATFANQPAALRVRTNFGSATDDLAGNLNVSVSAVPAADGSTLQWTRGGSAFTLEFRPRGMVWSLAGTATAANQTLRLALTAATGVDNQTQSYSVGGTVTSVTQTSHTNAQAEISGVPEYLTVSYLDAGRDAAAVFWPLSKTGNANWSGATGTASYVEFGLKSTASGALTASVAVVPCRKSELSRVLALLAANATTFLAGTASPVGPSLTAAAVNAAGDTLTLTFDEAATGQTGWTVITSGGPQYALPTGGDGTAAHTFTLARGVKSGERVALDFAATGVAVDASGNPLAPLTRYATNSSTRTNGLPDAIQTLSPVLALVAGPDFSRTDVAATTGSWGSGSFVGAWKTSVVASGTLTVGTVSSSAPTSLRAGGLWTVELQASHLGLNGSFATVGPLSGVEILILAKFNAIPSGASETSLFDMRNTSGNEILSMQARSASMRFRARSGSSSLREVFSASAPDTSWHVYGLSSDATGVKGWRDGTEIASGAAITGTYTVTKTTVGSEDDNSAKATGSSVALMVVFGAVLSTSQRAAAVSALRLLLGEVTSPTAPTIAISTSDGLDMVSVTVAGTAGTFSVSGYRLYAGDSAGGESSTPVATLSGSGTGTFAAQPTAEPGLSKYYVARAFDTTAAASSLSPVSNEVFSSTPCETQAPADIIRRLIIQLGLGSDPPTTPWPVYVGKEPGKPDNVITVRTTEGTDDGRSMIDGEVWGHPGFQVRVRARDYLTGRRKADAIANAFAVGVYQTVVAIDNCHFLVHAITHIGDVLDLGAETPNSQREVFTLNATCAVREL